MKKTNYDYIARVEKEISKKFGKDTIENPHAGWDEDKEEKYIEDCKIFQRKMAFFPREHPLKNCEFSRKWPFFKGQKRGFLEKNGIFPKGGPLHFWKFFFFKNREHF